MKKIITLLFSATMFASVFAQYGSGKDQRDNGYGNNNNSKNGCGNNAGAGNNGYSNSGCGSNGNSNCEKGKDVVYNDGRNKDNNFFNPRARDMQIAQINRDYDRKIQIVKNKFFMPRFRKEQVIYRLEDQRREEISMLVIKYNKGQDRFDGYGHVSKGGDDRDQRRNW